MKAIRRSFASNLIEGLGHILFWTWVSLEMVQWAHREEALRATSLLAGLGALVVYAGLTAWVLRTRPKPFELAAVMLVLFLLAGNGLVWQLKLNFAWFNLPWVLCAAVLFGSLNLFALLKLNRERREAKLDSA
ncbi:MAG: hypothetical protein JST35_10205 [Armatimonadetes bacterium]|nr:hypothetical protein [Armatimonadota bacterium]